MRLQGTNLIVVNVLASYVRILLVTGLTLFTSRWVLAALGQDEFGLYSLVGVLIFFILFIGNVMAASMQRFYAYAIGQNDPSEIQKWFNCAFVIHSLFALLLVLVGIPFGKVLMTFFLNIPPDRLATCYWVYGLSIVGAVWTMLAVPYIGMFHARQRIFELSFWNSIQALLIFVLAGSLFRLRGDLLFYYALGMVGIKLVLDAVQMLRARSLFKECRLHSRYWLGRSSYYSVLSYSGWQLWSGLGAILSNQGLGILINIFTGGTKANAGYGIAGQVNSAVSGIGVGVYQSAVSEIFRLEGAGERQAMIKLALRTSKFIVLLSLVWLLPLCIEMEAVFALWLDNNVPEYAVGFCRVILSAYVVNGFIMGYGAAVGAYGKVASYQSVQGTLLVMTFPLAWAAFKLGATPVQALFSLTFIAACCNVYCVLWVKKKLQVPVSRWLREVLGKCILCGVPSFLLGWWVYASLEPGLLRMSLVFVLCAGCTLLCAWLLAMDSEERGFCMSKVRRVLGFVFQPKN